jgi:hypothetical protein
MSWEVAGFEEGPPMWTTENRLKYNHDDLGFPILAKFNLPLSAMKFAADYHYENVVSPMLDGDFDGSLCLKSMFGSGRQSFK